MIFKLKYKSHFKIKNKFLKNKSKKIFVKNFLIFLFLNKIFLKNAIITFKFNKIKCDKTNLLKAPSRHKKFFHQICFEYFILSIFFKYSTVIKLNKHFIFKFNLFIKSFFMKFGSNSITNTKQTVSLKLLIPQKLTLIYLYKKYFNYTVKFKNKIFNSKFFFKKFFFFKNLILINCLVFFKKLIFNKNNKNQKNTHTYFFFKNYLF